MEKASRILANISDDMELESLRNDLIETQKLIDEIPSDDVVSLDALWEVRRTIVNDIHQVLEELGEKNIQEKRDKELVKFSKAWLERHYPTHEKSIEALHKYEKIVDRFIDNYGYSPE